MVCKRSNPVSALAYNLWSYNCIHEVT